MFIDIVAFSGFFALIPTGILVFKLKPRLLPIFDPLFEKRLSFVGWLAPSRRLARVQMYAVGVISKRVQKGTFSGLDMTSMVDKQTYRLCIIYTRLCSFMGICIAIFIVYRFLGWV